MKPPDSLASAKKPGGYGDRRLRNSTDSRPLRQAALAGDPGSSRAELAMTACPVWRTPQAKVSEKIVKHFGRLVNTKSKIIQRQKTTKTVHVHQQQGQNLVLGGLRGAAASPSAIKRTNTVRNPLNNASLPRLRRAARKARTGTGRGPACGKRPPSGRLAFNVILMMFNAVFCFLTERTAAGSGG
jgi:hypothetical protein